jgi:hypothetical protein
MNQHTSSGVKLEQVWGVVAVLRCAPPLSLIWNIFPGTGRPFTALRTILTCCDLQIFCCDLDYCLGTCVMLAQGAWRAWLCRLCAIDVVTHPAPDGIFFWYRAPLHHCPADYVDMLRLPNILTAASNSCLGVCVMLAQGVWRAWPCRLGAIGVVAHPDPDLEYFLV